MRMSMAPRSFGRQDAISEAESAWMPARRAWNVPKSETLEISRYRR